MSSKTSANFGYCTPTEDFKIGDVIRMKENCGKQSEGQILTVSKENGILIVTADRKNGYCNHPNKWELVDQKIQGHFKYSSIHYKLTAKRSKK